MLKNYKLINNTNKLLVFIAIILFSVIISKTYANNDIESSDKNIILSSHNSFLATQGNQYFLRHTTIAKYGISLVIQIKDNAHNILFSNKLTKDKDFSIDYQTGELSFTKPVYDFLDDDWLKNVEHNLLLISVDYNYFAKDYEIYDELYYYSLDGGINWLTQLGEGFAQVDDNYNIQDNYQVVAKLDVNLANNNVVANTSDTLTNSFLIGIADIEVIDRKVTGNRAFANSGSVDYPKRIVTKGKVQLYYRGLIRGEYLLNASIDTQREDNDILSYLDPDTNYAVYGDDSSVTDLSSEARGILYLLVEKDKSWLKWGKLKTQFPVQELSNINRSISGLGIHYESNETTKYGIPDTVIDSYYANLEAKRTRNEFLSTGGILYYLRYTNIIENTLKVSLEVRDSVNNNTLITKNLVAGVDFEVDANSGRLLFWRPIKQYLQSGLIIFDDDYDQNNIYVITDYNYSVSSDLTQANIANRVQQALNDDIVIGLQQQSEELSNRTYKAQGIDANIHINKDHVLDIELAKSNTASEAPFISNDGGINWSQKVVDNSQDNEQKGVSIKGSIKTEGDDNNLSYYYKKAATNLSENTSSVEGGKITAGFDKKYRSSEKLKLRAKYDLSDDINKTTTKNWQRADNLILQSNYQLSDNLIITSAFSHNIVNKYNTTNQQETNDQQSQFASQAEYAFSKDTKFNLRHQLTLANDSKQQTTIGAKHKINNNLEVVANTTFLTDKNNASNIDATYRANNGISLSAGTSKNSEGVNSSRIGGGYSNSSFSVGAGLENSNGSNKANISGGYSKDGASIGSGLTKNDDGSLAYNTSGAYVHNTKDNKQYRIAATNITDANNNSVQSLALGAYAPINDKTNIGVDTTLSSAKNDTRSVIATKLSHKISKERSINSKISRYTEKKDNSTSDGYDVELSGNINKDWSLVVNAGQGYVENEDNSRDKRTNFGVGTVYVRTDDEDNAVLKSSLNVSRRDDVGANNRTQYVFRSNIRGKYNKDLSIVNTIEWSRTNNKDTNTIDASNNRFDLNFAYRPVDNNKFNNLFKYTWVENNYPTDQVQENNIAADKGHVFSTDILYKTSRQWQLGTKLAMRFSKEKFGGIWYDNRLSLAALLAQYEILPETFVSLELRNLYNKRAKDDKRGFMLEVKRRFNDLIEAALGYNFSGYSSDLADLDYNIKGWYVRVTGVL